MEEVATAASEAATGAMERKISTGLNESQMEGFPDEVFEEYVALDIFTAAAIGHYERLSEFLLLETTDCDACNSGGWTPLMYAAYVGHDNAVNLLLDDGRLNVDVCSPTGCTALILAASCGNESVSYFLLQHAANINMRDMSGRTALFYAASQGHKTMVKLLLDNNADIDASESEFGMTPLMVAAQEGHEGVAGLLIDQGANVLAVSNFGHTARALAVRAGSAVILTLIDTATHDLRARPRSIRSEAGLSDDLVGGFTPPQYDGQWMAKAASSPRKHVHRHQQHHGRGGGRSHHHHNDNSHNDAHHRRQRPAAQTRSSHGAAGSASASSDIHKGPAAMAQLLSSATATLPSGTASHDLSPAEAALERGFFHESLPADESCATRENGSSSSGDDDGGNTSSSDGVGSSSSDGFDIGRNDDDDADDDNENGSLTGGDHFANMAASTVRAPSGESAGSSPQSSSMGRQLAELCSPSPEHKPSAGHGQQTSWENRAAGSTPAAAVANPHFSSRHGAIASVGTSTESDSPSSSQELANARAAAATSSSRSLRRPKTIEEFLSALNLSKYLSLFEEQDVNMHAFLTLTDNDLKEIGLKLFGPRRKITSAIARCHSQVWTGTHKLEQAYADHVDVQLKELRGKYQQCTEQLHSCHSQLQQEHDLRSVTEACLLDERAARQGLEQNAAIAQRTAKSARKQLHAAMKTQSILSDKLHKGLEQDGLHEVQQLAQQCSQQMNSAANALANGGGS